MTHTTLQRERCVDRKGASVAVSRSESICHVILHAERPQVALLWGLFTFRRVQGCASLLIKYHPLSFFRNLFTQPPTVTGATHNGQRYLYS